MDEEGETYVLEEVELEDDEDHDVHYSEVILDEEEDDDVEGVGEDLDSLLTVTRKAEVERVHITEEERPEIQEEGLQTIVRRPEVIDDFIRNFFVKAKLTRTLQTFQEEWYEATRTGEVDAQKLSSVPDVYLKNQQLEDSIRKMEADLSHAKEVARNAKATWDNFRKERDFHRMHHKRVTQEKNKLVKDLKRLKLHYEKYEPLLKEMRGKYETAMKEKMLARIEKDKMAAKVQALEETIRQMDSAPSRAEKRKEGEVDEKKKRIKGNKDSELPPDDRDNPFLRAQLPSADVQAFGPKTSHKGHNMAVSCLALHPRKPILATGSDDTSWKIWSLPNAELIMSGEGHHDWVSGVDFSPLGGHLATSSGDGTVKIWDFSSASCATTFSDHTQAVWAVAYHDQGDFLVSCSLDHTSKLWDLGSERCRQTFRGHLDSVNSVCFQPFSNHICTCSGDKTVSMWDVRSGLCIQTFYGHTNACSHVSINMKGDSIASCDSDGVVKLWDIRMVSERAESNCGPFPANKVAFDPSAKFVAVGSDDGKVKIIDSSNGSVVKEISGHDDAVQAVIFDPAGKFLISSGSDCSFRTWS